MTKIDFYVLPDEALQHRYLFACRLIEKAYNLGHKVYVHGSSQQQLEKLNQLLWSFKANSFIPHSIYPSPETSTSSSTNTDNSAKNLPTKEVVLSAEAPPNDYNEVLINLSNQVPGFFSRFERVSEIVIAHEEIKKATRANYRFYRERGYDVKTHQLGGNKQ